MKAAINEKGVLTVTSESPLEAFALQQWALLANGDACEADTYPAARLHIDYSQTEEGPPF